MPKTRKTAAMTAPTFELEEAHGGMVIGIDEAGRGCLAGPVVAAAAWINRKEFPPDLLALINDSKKLSRAKREEIYTRLRTLPRDVFAFAFARIEATEIDEINILQASLKAMKLAASRIAIPFNLALVDGNKTPDGLRAEAVIGGDAKSFSIAAASIVAKCEKDFALDEIGRKFPEYGFEKNAGYGTAVHMAALAKHGPCPEHRKTYAPVRAISTAS